MKLDDLQKSRKEARALGLTLYFTGKPCPKGHISARRVNCKSESAYCEECLREKNRRARRGQSRWQMRKVEIRRRIEAHQAGEPYDQWGLPP